MSTMDETEKRIVTPEAIRGQEPEESTALVVSRGLSKIEELLGRLDRNYEHHTEEYNAVAGTLLRIEHSRKKADAAVDRLPELVARVATIERWLISLADSVLGSDVIGQPDAAARLEEWAVNFQAWLKAGGRPDMMPGVVGPMSPMGGRRDR